MPMSVDTATATATSAEPTSRQVTMTLEEALAFAVQRHQAGDLDQAEPIYDLVLQRHPERLDVLNYLGILKHQRGELDAALALMQRLVDRAPESDGVWNNLGNVFLALGRDEEAAAAFTRSIELVDSPQVWSNLARAWRRRGQLEQSERACRHALELAPRHGPAMHNLALALLAQRRAAEGVETALEAMQLLAEHEQRRSVYIRLLLVAGEREQAAVILRAWQAQEPDNPYVAHQLAACTGEAAPERASDAYVETLFDSFATTFDSKLASLDYCAPARVVEALAADLAAPARQFAVADLGCGTGLCGPLLRPWARRLVGCDLSAAMMARAQGLGVYDELQKAELTAFLDAHPDSFDVIVSADTFVYFGDLAAAAHAMARALRAGGHIAFSLEAMAPSESGDYVLRASGRYAHPADYVRRVFAAAGLRVDAMVGAVLRQEAMAPVQGWVVTASRAA
jgi:predicted TPR repeat methyltransferase